VPARDGRGKGLAAWPAPARPQRADESAADAPPLTAIDDCERDLGRPRALRLADEASDADDAPGRSLDRRHCLAATAADVDEDVELTFSEARLRAVEPTPSRGLRESVEDVEHRRAIAGL